MNTAVKMLVLSASAVILICSLSGCLLRHSGGTDQPLDAPSLTDIDNDGIPDVSDDDIDNDGKINVTDTDMDGDKTPNTQDTDSDGDGIDNIDDNDIDGDGIINEQDADIDGDGTTNTNDDDSDGDGIDNIDDNDIDGDGIINEQDADIDGDGASNGQDADLDNDGIPNGDDIDIDGDGISNSEDSDIDNDGTSNNQDSTPGGTGTDVDGTQGDTNTGTDTDDGTANTGTDTNTGETGTDDYVPGLGVVAVDTVAYTLKIPTSQGTGTISTSETINLQKVRDEIENNDIALSTFDLTDLSIITSASNSFVQANSDTRIVVTVSYLDAGNNKIPVLESVAADGPVATVLTIGDLASGIRLNDDVFAVPAGFNSFTGLIKNESTPSVSTVIDINFLDAPSQGGADLDVDFILRATGIQPF